MQESAWAVWKRLEAEVIFESPNGMHIHPSRSSRLPSELVWTIRSRLSRTENTLGIFSHSYLEGPIRCEENKPTSEAHMRLWDVWSMTFDKDAIETRGTRRFTENKEMNRTASKSDWSVDRNSGDFSEAILTEVFSKYLLLSFVFWKDYSVQKMFRNCNRDQIHHSSLLS